MIAISAILDIGMERFYNSESQCHSDQVSAQSDLHFGTRYKMSFEVQDGRLLGYQNGTI